MTSMPASRRARAMILAPRSCPSSPGLATTTLILRSVAAAGMRSRSDADEDRVALSAARADRGAAQPAAAAAQLVDERGEDSRAGGADRVAERDGAAVDVDALLVDAEHPDRRDHDRCERLVDLPQVDVGGVDAGLRERRP